ncbi:hypothetical protein FC19_GL000560 [Liquorilactobacillus aquaticus DSM 21051]|uniref:HTH merR-type domain-containing protein n=1 Tax=Liquorilactobacillus aquaticus DSM 21051 TaxID=1423725 RepID=A0A0R2CXA7_9LACO|nr:hypothetical protein FC19_GL000560 [Liquorilactobacillus aquaticus DSM 21051]
MEMVLALRHTGMSLKSIKNYIDLCNLGDNSVNERLDIIKAELNKAEEKVNDSIKQRDVLKEKLEYYRQAIKVGEKNVIWGTKRKFKQ